MAESQTNAALRDRFAEYIGLTLRDVRAMWPSEMKRAGIEPPSGTDTVVVLCFDGGAGLVVFADSECKRPGHALMCEVRRPK